MTGLAERTDGIGAAVGDRLRVPRRPAVWGSRVRWTRHRAHGVVLAVVGWQVSEHVLAGGPSGEVLCPFGGFDAAWTWVATRRTVAHMRTANLVLAAAVLVPAVFGRGRPSSGPSAATPARSGRCGHSLDT